MRRRILNCINIFFVAIVFIVAFTFSTFASPDTLCNGKEFNQRVKAFLSGNDRAATIENTISSFQRGYNPPDDPAYYVDISEDRDGSIIAYIKSNNLSADGTSSNYTLYWYSDGIANMNPNAAFMFDKFVRIRNIDLSDFAYLKGLTDTRYMFMECRNLRTIRFKQNSATREFMPSEMQGMFFSCQSLSNVDLTLFNTKMVDNMDELFYKCYNLKNIYVDTTRWNIENVRSFTRMFSECHSLRTNEGKKAVDIPEDKYEDYAVAGNNNREGFIKDVNYEYSDYGEYIASVPIDGANYITTQPETTQPYAEEPEYDGQIGSGSGNGNIPYVGNSGSGYGDEKQSQQSSNNIITPTEGAISPNRPTDAAVSETTATAQNSTNVNQSVVIESQATIEPSPIVEPSSAVEQAETSNVETSEIANTTENIITETELEISETIATNETSEVSIDDETSGRRIMELEDFLKGQDQDGNDGKGELLGTLFDNYKFLIFALVISAIVILLLVGMVVYLTKSNMENKDDESHKI